MITHSNKLLVANNSTINSFTHDQSNMTASVNTDKLTASTNRDRKENTDNNELRLKSNNSIPSSYNISGGYE